ncbi:MAG: OmpA family protein [Pseudomonadota bacterium]
MIRTQPRIANRNAVPSSLGVATIERFAIRVTTCTLMGLWAGTVSALDLPPGARITREDTTDFATLALPVSEWSEGGMEMIERDGTITRRAWRVPETSLTTLQAAGPVRRDLEERGFKVLFDCSTSDCGGFDFRYALDLLPEPEMHVNLGDFRFITATRADPETALGIMISRGAGDLYIHEIRSAETPEQPRVLDPSPEPAKDAENTRPNPVPVIAGRNGDTLTARLETYGRVVLDDLVFATGSAALEPRAFPSLVELAAWLNETPDAALVLVGHSDAVGGLDGNIALSRQRAESVADRLVSAHTVAPGQLRAEGVGYLAPVASNATPEGRALNRRVEAILMDPG